MPEAIGVIQTIGFPGVLAAADAMVKNGSVTLVSYQGAESGQYYVSVRGRVSEVKRAVEAGVAAVENQANGAKLQNYYIVPHPTENVEQTLDMNHNEISDPYRQ
ncbi:MAG: carbon dioxide-concentrating mechanism protein CcmK [Cyanobacteria bacterium J06642_2]